MSTPVYSTFTALVCSLELLALCWLAGIPLSGFDGSTQLSLLGLLILPQLLGLGALNFVLGRAPATTVSVLLLLESPIAALAAWSLMSQSVEPATAPWLLLIIVGVALVVTNGGSERVVARKRGLRGTADEAPAAAHGRGEAEKGEVVAGDALVAVRLSRPRTGDRGLPRTHGVCAGRAVHRGLSPTAPPHAPD
ncbi:hypothetical protein [Streptomyces sp. NBC_01808]|uniref:hypothetical protein n=1 Tax=Streptomyces sp. NBC_01808 TaxID=2975947 RepID=UPI003FA3D5D7